MPSFAEKSNHRPQYIAGVTWRCGSPERRANAAVATAERGKTSVGDAGEEAKPMIDNMGPADHGPQMRVKEKAGSTPPAAMNSSRPIGQGV